MKAWITVDMQWGSTGKGLINGYLARERKADTVVAMNGRNSGHTYMFDSGRKVVNYTLPSGFISNSVKTILLGPDSVICPETLEKELNDYTDLIGNKAILIHPHATVIHSRHKEIESHSLNRISSTLQGVGAAQIDKVMRKEYAVAKGCNEYVIDYHTTTIEQYNEAICSAERLQIEGCQGFELSINSGHMYPYVTSREITTHSILSGCGIPYFISPEVIGVVRSYPIRVGHAYDGEGEKIGDSGPFYPDQVEFTWSELGLEPESTTCTGKIRRIFSWSDISFRKALMMLYPESVFVNFTNYLEESPKFGHGVTGAFVNRIENAHRYFMRSFGLLPNSVGPFVKWMGVGPRHSNVIVRPEVECL